MKPIALYENLKHVKEIVELRLDGVEKEAETLTKEKENLLQLKKTYDNKLKEIEKQLKTLKGIEYSLYYEIMVNGLSVNKAITKVALQYDVSDSTIWKTYYPDLKHKLEQNNNSKNPF